MKNHEGGTSNKSDNRSFESVLASYSSRRQVLRGSLELAAAVFFASSPAATMAGPKGQGAGGGQARRGLMDFTPVPVEGGGGPDPRIAAEYEMQVLIPWGDPIDPAHGPAFDWPPSAEQQARQIGIGHDGMWYFPLDRSGDRGVLAVNHEFGSDDHLLGHSPAGLDDVRVSQHAHGVSVVELAKVNGEWRNVASGYARRVHVNTPVQFSGPAASSQRLLNPAGNDYLGTLNNCSNGYTPWGTYLTCEENVHFYFGAPSGGWEPDPLQDRYGFAGFWPFFFYGWAFHDERFDLANPGYVNECNRFGWVVEIDPMKPSAPPVKRTALGRFRHEGCALAVGRGGRVVGYMGDDSFDEYIYKFVSDKNWEALRAQGESPLDHGKLYAAKFNDDGTGEWLELTIEDPRIAAELNDQAEVLMFARRAADLLGATKMARPEWTAVGPDEQVYCTLTAGHDGEGSILRWRDSDHHVGTRFEWDVFLIASDTFGTEGTFSACDGLWVDPDGRVFIQTDGRGQPSGLNDQMLVADTDTGDIKRLFEGVPGCEVTGIAVTPDRRTMFINVQHPGTGDPAQTNFPYPRDGVTIPRDATIAIRRKDGGIVGS